MMELVLAKLPPWLEAQMRNLNCQSYTELTESIVRHLGNQRTKTERYHLERKKSINRFPKEHTTMWQVKTLERMPLLKHSIVRRSREGGDLSTPQ